MDYDKLDAIYRADGWGDLAEAALNTRPFNVEGQARKVASYAAARIRQMDAENAALRERLAAAEGRVLHEDDVEWVVNDIAELGVKIGNQFFFLYKGSSLVYGKDGPPLHDDTDQPMKWRPVFKREFGECCHPINHQDYSRIGTVSLDDSDDWQNLPIALSPAAPDPLAEGLAVAGDAILDAFCVLEDSAQIAAMEELNTALAAYRAANPQEPT